MDEEMSALQSRRTWDLVVAPHDAEIVSYRWVFTVKTNLIVLLTYTRPVLLLVGLHSLIRLITLRPSL